MPEGSTRPSRIRSAPRPQGSPEPVPASPILDRVLECVEVLGPEVRVQPRADRLLLCRQQTFGAIRHSGRGVVLGLYLPGSLVGDRLMDGAAFRLNRVSHQVVLRSPDDVDEQVRAWLARAYDRG